MQMHKQQATVAYFSMEVGLDPAMPTYSGGLGVLAADTLRAAADLGVPLVGVTLLYHKGYFRQHLDKKGTQKESPVNWHIEEFLEHMEPWVTVNVEGRPVRVKAWRYLVHGVSGHDVPVYFLDTALPANSPWDRSLTDHLYGGDPHYRLCQELVLGLGSVAMLRALGHDRIQTYHMNEGHSALLTLALLEEQAAGRPLRDLTVSDWEAVRQRCVFTTHTPISAGHDQFPIDLVRQVLEGKYIDAIEAVRCCTPGVLNMTHQALFFARYINGVSLRHEEISQAMFPNYPINSITNGVHAVTWTSPSFRRLYDRYIPEWRRDNLYLRYVINIPVEEIQQAHAEAKRDMLAEVKQRTGISLDPTVLTLGFARRATAYKRLDLLFSEPDRLKAITRKVGRMQIIYGGKAHPQDEGGKAVIRRVLEAADGMRDAIPVVYLEEYDLTLAKYLCAGVDLWLNTPQKPLEASGTSGMKAALNGVPSLGVLDGWWVEGHAEGVTGWSIGDSLEAESNSAKESASLYDKLQHFVLPLFYERPRAFAQVMRYAIAFNASYYNAQRMVSQYVQHAYVGS